MTLRLDYLPIQPNYSSDLLEGVNRETPLDGGMSRKRSDIVTPWHVVQCTWLLTEAEYDIFMGFFRTSIKNSSQPFLLDIITDIGIPTTHLCRTIGGEPKLVRQSGDGYWVQATLQAKANPTITSYIYEEEGSWDFDGANDQITLGNALNFERTNSFSVSAWVVTDGTGSSAHAKLFERMTSTGSRGYHVAIDQTGAPSAAGTVDFSMGQFTGNFFRTRTTNTFPLNTLTHLAVTYNGTSGVNGVQFYFNGVLQSKTAVSVSAIANIAGIGTFLIGNGLSDPGSDFKGSITNFTVWNTTLNSTQVSELFAQGQGGNPTTASFAANLQAAFRIDGRDSPGTNGVIDFSANGNHGTAQNGIGDTVTLGDLVTYQPAKSEWRFDGVDDRINMGNVLSKERTDSFSMSFWMCTTSTAAFQTPIGKQNGTRGYSLFLTSTGAVGFQLLGTPLSLRVDTSKTGFNDGNLHNVTVTYLGAANTTPTSIVIYVDGARMPTTTISNTFGNSTLISTANFRLGARDAATPVNFCTGVFQHFSFWGTVLTAAQVRELYNNGTPLENLLASSMSASLQGWWKVDGSDTTAASGVEDHSTNNNHGTCEGSFGGDVGYHLIYPRITIDYVAGDSLQIIDSVGIHPTGSVALNLDGVYEIDNILGFNSIRLVNPELVNTNWYKLYNINSNYGGLTSGQVISTITKVPT
jgi:hypothetical protein